VPAASSLGGGRRSVLCYIQAGPGLAGPRFFALDLSLYLGM
jgi:hypothetical protein